MRFSRRRKPRKPNTPVPPFEQNLAEDEIDPAAFPAHTHRMVNKISSATGRAGNPLPAEAGTERYADRMPQRGINSTAFTIAETISAHSVQAAPVALVRSVTTVAL